MWHSCAQPGDFRCPKCSAHNTFNTATSRCSRRCCRPCAKKKKKKPERGRRGETHSEAEGADGPCLRGPGAAGGSGFTAPHASPDVGRTLWKFKIPDGSFWVVCFFFSLPHFQGNKTHCHLLVAIEISPDSASAEEKAGRAHCCRGATSRDRLQTYWEEQR